MNLLSVILASFLLTSCGIFPTINYDPYILGQEEFQDLKYVEKADETLLLVGKASVTTSGAKANILNTVPELFKKAQEFKNRSASTMNRENKTYISKIDIRIKSQLEDYQVSYQDCRNVTVYKQVPQQVCGNTYGYNGKSSYSCQTKYVYANVNENKCETKYRTEKRWVLYHIAEAEVYR